MRRWTLMELVIVTTVAILLVLSVAIFNQLNSNRSRPEAAESPPDNRLHLALVYQEEKSAYWTAVKEGARHAAEKHRVQVEFLGPEVTDMVEQVDLLNRAIASKVDGIIVQGMNGEAFTPLINKAVERGIPVLTIDSDAPASKRLAYVGTDNFAAGVLAGEQIRQRLQGRGNVGVVIGNFHATNQRLRLKGIQEALTTSPEIRIAAIEDSQAYPFLAASVTERMLEAHPELDLVIGLSTSDGPGISEAVKRSGRSQQVDVLVFGFEPMDILSAYVREGVIDVVFLEEPYRMGYQAVETMLQVKRGRVVPPQIFTRVRISANPVGAERR